MTRAYSKITRNKSPEFILFFQKFLAPIPPNYLMKQRVIKHNITPVPQSDLKE